ncbi:MAG: acyltransferase [Oxalobacteraceae bacterium]|nr:MAG: acyltransferase [Oxalobacteraceae bacterium]
MRHRVGGFGMSEAEWKRTKFRSVILRVQGSKFLPDRMRRALLNYAGAQIHPTATVRHSCWLASADIVMGRNAMLNNFAYYDGGARLTLEDGARVAAYSIFTTSTHPHSGDPARRSSPSIIVAPITVKTGTWIMARVTVNPGVTIASGCMIGAGSVVTESTEPNGLYVNAIGSSGTVRARRVRELGNGETGDARFGDGVIDLSPSLARRRQSAPSPTPLP